MKAWRFVAMLAALLCGPALAEDAVVPAPLPDFHAPQMDGTAGADAQPPATTTTTTGTGSATQAIARVTATPQPVTLSAQITEGGATIRDGLVWRIFSARPDASGELSLAAKSESGVASVRLSPGSYVVHVAYGRAQASDTITVAEGQNTKKMVLDAGGLRLNAAITGDLPIPINLLRFDVFTSGETDADRQLVAQNLGANDIVTLNAGTYHIVSYFGAVNAVVRADLRVEPGKLTDATLYHRAAQVSFKLVSEAGGEAIADIDWTVKNSDGTTVFTNTGTFPSTVLQEGDYTVLAKRGDQVFNRDFQVQAGPAKEIEVLTAVY